jgi:hypothetical protein
MPRDLFSCGLLRFAQAVSNSNAAHQRFSGGSRPAFAALDIADVLLRKTKEITDLFLRLSLRSQFLDDVRKCVHRPQIYSLR